MARNFGRRGGAIKPPQRQIANEVVEGNAQITFAAATLGTAVGSVGLILTAAALTLVRSRGVFSVLLTNSGTSDAIIQAAFGIIVVQTEAFSIGGLNSLPTPLSDGERPWVVWQPLSVVAIGTNPDQGQPDVFAQVAVDSRGMRKLKEGEVLAYMFEAQQLSGTTGTVINLAYAMRHQFKL